MQLSGALIAKLNDAYMRHLASMSERSFRLRKTMCDYARRKLIWHKFIVN